MLHVLCALSGLLCWSVSCALFVVHLCIRFPRCFPFTTPPCYLVKFVLLCINNDCVPLMVCQSMFVFICLLCSLAPCILYVLLFFIKHSLHLDPCLCLLFHHVTDWLTTMDLAGVNLDPVSALCSLFQGGRPIEHFVEEFLWYSHLASLDDARLMDCFWSGLDDNIAQLMPGGNSALSSPPVAPLSSSMTAAPSVSEVDVLLSMLPVMAMAILCIWAVHTSPVSPETASSSELSVFPKATVTAMNAVSELLVSIEFPIMTVDTVSELSVFHDATVMAANAVYELLCPWIPYYDCWHCFWTLCLPCLGQEGS